MFTHFPSPLHARVLKLLVSRATTLAFLGIIAAWSLQCTKRESHPGSGDGSADVGGIHTSLSRVQLPSTLTVFGEVIPLDITEVHERCERELYLNLQTPGQLILQIKRSGRYFELFSTLSKEMGVPADVRYLSVAESALFMTRSQKDAVGLWQFMEGTARSYGLRIDDYVDERKHVEKSTRAALRYLKDAYRLFGSWTLAAAAYNMGMEGVRSAMESQHTTTYFDTYLNDETSRYVPRIAIIKEIMEHGDRYGVSVPSDRLYSPAISRTVVVTGTIHNLASWAEQQKCSYKDVKLSNPWILGSSLPHGRWEILVPGK